MSESIADNYVKAMIRVSTFPMMCREKAVGASLRMQPVKVALEQEGRNKSNPSVRSALLAHKVRHD